METTMTAFILGSITLLGAGYAVVRSVTTKVSKGAKQAFEAGQAQKN